MRMAKAPLVFTSKFFPLLHLDGAMCGTGSANFTMGWFNLIQTQCVVRDIVNLDSFTPDRLRDLYEEYRKQPGMGENFLSTVYHFGYSVDLNSFVGFAYRSTSNFESERLQNSVGYKPELSTGFPVVENFPDDFIKIMEQQKQEDEELTRVKRLGIGGDIHLLSMQPGEINIRRCHRFSDYESTFRQMCINLSSDSN